MKVSVPGAGVKPRVLVLAWSNRLVATVNGTVCAGETVGNNSDHTLNPTRQKFRTKLGCIQGEAMTVLVMGNTRGGDGYIKKIEDGLCFSIRAEELLSTRRIA